MTSVDVAPRQARELLDWTRATIDAPLRALLDLLPEESREVVEHHRGGQDPFVAALTLLSAATVGDAARAVDVAVAMELASLHEQLHADVMSGAVSRGHQPSTWVVFGESRATSTAEALLSLAFARLSKPHVMMLNVALLSVVDGYVQEVEMDEDEGEDVEVDIAAYLGVAGAKHASLPACACELGALAVEASASQAEHLRQFGDDIGMARKHVDDVLAIWGGPALSGRPLHDDLAHRRRTLPVVAALVEVPTLYDDFEEPAALAAEIERAGGRAWCEQQAELLLARALDHLRRAQPRGRAADELFGLAREVTTARCASARTPAPVVPSQSTAESREDRTLA